MFKLRLPASGANDDYLLESSTSIIFVGANGSGKTRLGVQIERYRDQCVRTHRISAQKSLSMPSTANPTSKLLAENALLYGAQNEYQAQEAIKNPVDYKEHSRWNSTPSTSLLNDFDKLLVYLFTEEYEKSTTYRQRIKFQNIQEDPPETKLDIVKKLWEQVFPHRGLEIKPSKIETYIKAKPNSIYSCSEMSDGERVVFYLIGQVLAVPQDGIIIIDEPELHIHKSIQTTLWTALESARPDCLFVYFTHDTKFAASLPNATKIWLKSFDGQIWEWEEVPRIDSFPEDLLLQIIGSRRQVLFVEGDVGSYDTSLFQILFPHYFIVPRGSCTQVIESTRALRKIPQLHHLNPQGLIDRDRRPDHELDTLAKDGIYSLNVAEIENLFCTPEILSIVADHLGLDVNTVQRNAETLLFKSLNSELEIQISLHVLSEVRFQLNQLGDNHRGVVAINKALDSLRSRIDVDTIYADFCQKFTTILNDKDYKAALRLYNRKSLANQMSTYLDLKSGALPLLVVRLAREQKRSAILLALKLYIPEELFIEERTNT